MLDAASRKGGTPASGCSTSPRRRCWQKGFAATSIDELIAGAGITKSGFFYHFKDKTELAKALLLRYLERDRRCSTTSSGGRTNCTTIRCMASWSG